MATETDISNRALTKLGARNIASMGENSVNARACTATLPAVRDSELRVHPWSFAIKQASLAASATPPSWGKANSFPLPSDFIRFIGTYPEMNENDIDYQIQNGKIYTNFLAPLQFLYVAGITDPTQWDPLFREAVASKMAYELCEQLTQSNTKKAALMQEYKEMIAQARLVNAFENIAGVPPEDEWITTRV